MQRITVSRYKVRGENYWSYRRFNLRKLNGGRRFDSAEVRIILIKPKKYISLT